MDAAIATATVIVVDATANKKIRENENVQKQLSKPRTGDQPCATLITDNG